MTPRTYSSSTLQVLGSFIRSFRVINELAHTSETEVFESYLESMWREMGMGDPPSTRQGIALMRLAVQAQTAEKQSAVVEAFHQLSEGDQRVLADEMALTGVAGQSYKHIPAISSGLGPSILVYYSPAFVRFLAPGAALEALRLLAEIYRRARHLWPLKPLSDTVGESGSTVGGSSVGGSSVGGGSVGGSSVGGAASHVTIRIDQIKELTVQDIRSVYSSGDSWLLTKRNELEAVVERHPLEHMSELLQKGVQTAVLKFWAPNDGSKGGSSANSSGGSEAASIGSLDSIGAQLVGLGPVSSASLTKLNKRLSQRPPSK